MFLFCFCASGRRFLLLEKNPHVGGWFVAYCEPPGN